MLRQPDTAIPGAEAELDLHLRSAPSPDDRWGLEFARRFDHALRATVPLFGNPVYLRATFGTAKTRRRLVESIGEERAKDVLHALEAERLSPDAAVELALHLRSIALDRANSRRQNHAKMALRGALLESMLPPLLVLVVANAIVLAVAGHTRGWFIAVAALTGALGSVLSGSFRLRDDLRRLTDLRAFRPAIWLQPLLGAASGLFASLVVLADVVRIPTDSSTPDLTAYGIFGFLAGFSEPFLLGIVKRLSEEPGPVASAPAKKKGGQ